MEDDIKEAILNVTRQMVIISQRKEFQKCPSNQLLILVIREVLVSMIKDCREHDQTPIVRVIAQQSAHDILRKFNAAAEIVKKIDITSAFEGEECNAQNN